MDFYVSLQGKDDWSGTLAEPNGGGLDGPFATVERARDAIRELKRDKSLPAGGCTVFVRGGDYVREHAFLLQKEDSGSERAPVVYRSQPGERVRLLGGRAVTTWDPLTDPAVLARLDEDAREHVVQADLRANGITDFGRLRRRPGRGVPAHLELFFGGQPMTLARWPNEGWTHLVRGAGEAKDAGHRTPWMISPTEDGFYYEGDRPKRWQSHEGVWVHGFWAWDWRNTYVPVDLLDTERRLMVTQPPHDPSGYRANQHFHFLNVLEELDSPGEYYVDVETGMLYFWPPGALDQHEVLASVLEEPMVRMNDAAHVHLQGLTLACSRGQGVVIQGGTGNLIAGCTIRNVGNDGVVVQGGNRHGVVSCDISEVGDAAVILEGGERRTLAPCGHFVHNNHIWHFSRWSKTYTPAVHLTGVGMRVSHNLIHDAPHIAILYYGNENVIEYNDIHHVCLETGDTGAIYTGRDYTARGNVIRHNYVHEMGGIGDVGSNGMYFDDCVSGQTFHGNVLRNAPRAVFIGGGREVVVQNNIFVDCDPSIQVDASGIDPLSVWQNMVYQTMKKRLDAMHPHQPPYSERYPELLQLDAYYDRDKGVPPGNIVIERNISVGGSWLHLHWFATEEHVTVGENLVGVDPHFVDGERGDYRLQADSPAWPMGFQQIPFDQIGLVEDEHRRGTRAECDRRKVCHSGRLAPDPIESAAWA